MLPYSIFYTSKSANNSLIYRQSNLLFNMQLPPSCSQSGFGLLQLLITLSLFFILSLICLPYLFSARRAAQESRAIANLRTINNQQLSFYASQGKFALLEELYQDGYLSHGTFQRQINQTLGATEVISDGCYEYSLRYTNNAIGYTLDADPLYRQRCHYRFFRLRTYRQLKTFVSGNELILAAPPQPDYRTPPASQYQPVRF
jgi:type II secretory pathway pseudopilin PulG